MPLKTKNNKIAVNEEISNVSVNIIRITEDKLVNILNTHINKIKKNNDWITSGSLFISLACVAVTSEFHNTFGLNADVIKGIFYAGLFASFIYFIVVIIHCIKNKDSISKIVKEIKNEE